MLCGEGHVGQDVFFGAVHKDHQLGHCRPELIGNAAPLRLGRHGSMINPAWPEIAKAAPANLHHQMGHDQRNGEHTRRRLLGSHFKRPNEYHDAR